MCTDWFDMMWRQVYTPQWKLNQSLFLGAINKRKIWAPLMKPIYWKLIN